MAKTIKLQIIKSIDSLIEAIEKATEDSLTQLGNDSTTYMKQLVVKGEGSPYATYDVHHLLKDSMGYKTSQGGTLETTKTPKSGEALVGASAPHASTVNYGYGPLGDGTHGGLTYGVNGNASSFDGLVADIIEWANEKGIEVNAKSVAENLIENGHAGYFFLENTYNHTRDMLIDIAKQYIADKASKLKSKGQQVIKVNLKL